MANQVNPASAPTLSGTMTATGQPAGPEQIAQELQQYGSQLGLSQQDIAAANSQLNLLRQSQQPVIDVAQTQYEQATGQAGAAEREYTAAMQGPEPNVPIGSQLTRMLLAGARGAFSGEGFKPQETEQQRIDKEREALLSARKDNITRLRDLYTKKAEAAQKLGMETDELKARTKADSLTKTLESMASMAEERRKAKDRQAENEAKRAQEIAEAERKRAEKAPEDLDKLVNRLNDNIRMDNTVKLFDTAFGNYQQARYTRNHLYDGTGVDDTTLIRALALAADVKTGVKEGEAKLYADNAKGYLDQLGIEYHWNKFKTGTFLTPRSRKIIADRLEQYMRDISDIYEPTIQSYLDYANQQGIDEKYIPGFARFRKYKQIMNSGKPLGGSGGGGGDVFGEE